MLKFNADRKAERVRVFELGRVFARDPAVAEGHANSPDGYCVLAVECSAEGFAVVDWARRREGAPPPAGTYTAILPALVELKAPYSRIPSGRVPKHYAPQLQSGLVFCEAAAVALFLEVVYRLATLPQLGDGTRDYCAAYHRGDAKKAPWPDGAPVAWGVTAVYAPYIGGAPPGTKAGAGAERTAERRDAELFGAC